MELADSIRSRLNVRKRRVTIGQHSRFTGEDPVAIAKALRAKSSLGRREAKQEAMERVG